VLPKRLRLLFTSLRRPEDGRLRRHDVSELAGGLPQLRLLLDSAQQQRQRRRRRRRRAQRVQRPHDGRAAPRARRQQDRRLLRAPRRGRRLGVRDGQLGAHPAPPTRHKRRRAEAAGRAAPARGAPAVQQWPAQRMRFSLDAGLCDSAESAPPPPARGAKPGAGLAPDPGVDLAPDPGADGWASVWRSLEDAARRPPFGGAGAEWRALLAAATLASDSGASSSCALGLGFGGKEVGQACGAAHAQVQVWPKPVCF